MLQQQDVQRNQHDQGEENGFPLEKTSDGGRGACAEHEEEDDGQMSEGIFECAFVSLDAHNQQGEGLGKVVGAEGGGHGLSLERVEGIVLNGGDEVDGNLRNLEGGRFRQATQENDDANLQQDEPRSTGATPNGAVLLRQCLREYGSQCKRQGGNEIGCGNRRLSAHQVHCAQQHVDGLRTAKNAASQQICKSPEITAHKHQRQKGGKLLMRGGVLLL